MKQSFEKSLVLVLMHEGGWSNHPSDPGGATMRGVIQRVYDAYRDSKELARRSVRYLNEHELREIYRHQYWDKIHGDDLPSGLDYCAFDAAVNSGPGQAAKWLQRALGVTDDGAIGPITLAAAMQCDIRRIIIRMCAARLRMLRGLRTWSVFGNGWGRRVTNVETRSIAMIS